MSSPHKPLLHLGLLPVIHHRVNAAVVGRAEDGGPGPGIPVVFLAVRSDGGRGVEERVGDALLGRLEQTDHGGVAAAFGFAGQRVRVRERFD